MGRISKDTKRKVVLNRRNADEENEEEESDSDEIFSIKLNGMYQKL